LPQKPESSDAKRDPRAQLIEDKLCEIIGSGLFDVRAGTHYSLTATFEVLPTKRLKVELKQHQIGEM
jgi:hypothetical protein